MNIIGLGQAGCAIAEKFKQYPQYNVFKIDVGLKGKQCFDMPLQPHPEQYEENCPILKLRAFLKGIKGDVLFIGSCGSISGSNLRILEQLSKGKKCKISVLYIKPERDLLSEQQLLQENLIFGVWQEYARSGVFEGIYLVSNSEVSTVIGDVPVREYYERINQTIASAFHLINVFEHSEPIMHTFASPIASTRLLTLGVVDIDTGDENLFFPLEMVRDKKYYYAIPEKILDEDTKLLKNIKAQVKEKNIPEQAKATYGIFSTKYEQSFAFCVARASMIQKNEKIA